MWKSIDHLNPIEETIVNSVEPQNKLPYVDMEVVNRVYGLIQDGKALPTIEWQRTLTLFEMAAHDLQYAFANEEQMDDIQDEQVWNLARKAILPLV